VFGRNKTNDSGKTAISTEEYEKCLKRFIEIDSRIGILENKFKLLQTDYENLRGNFNRKLKGLKEEEQKEETKEINTSFELPFG